MIFNKPSTHVNSTAKYYCGFPVNYRGSTGFGQDSILSLIGNVGSQDVKDMQVQCPSLEQ